MKYSYKIKTTKGTTWIIPACAALSLWHSRLTLPGCFNQNFWSFPGYWRRNAMLLVVTNQFILCNSGVFTTKRTQMIK